MHVDHEANSDQRMIEGGVKRDGDVVLGVEHVAHGGEAVAELDGDLVIVTGVDEINADRLLRRGGDVVVRRHVSNNRRSSCPC